MSTEEFVEHGKDADYWIYTSPGVNSAVYSEFKDELKDFVSVKNNNVYDTEGAGQNSWFEQRLAEPGKFRFVPCCCHAR
jgi:ABC-type Fe3+-hydroxamate transport system substrate-binding protein